MVVATIVKDDSQIQLRIYDHAAESQDMILTTIFMLPTLLTDSRIKGVNLSGTWPTTDRLVHAPPYYGSIRTRIYLLEFVIKDGGGNERVFNLIVPRMVLQGRHRERDSSLKESLAHPLDTHGKRGDGDGNIPEQVPIKSLQAPSSSSSTPDPTVVPWEEWGPNGTRLFELEAVGAWKSAQHASKYVRPVVEHPSGGAEHPRYHVQFNEFNDSSLVIHRSRVFSQFDFQHQGHGKSLLNSVSMRLMDVDAPTLIDRKDVFEDVVTTRLPYLVKTTSETFDFSILSLDQMNVLGIEVSSARDILFFFGAASS